MRPIRTVLVLGGNSEIARATLRELLKEGPLTAILAVRDPEAVDAGGLAGATVETTRFDAAALDTHAAAIAAAFDRPEDVDLVLLAHGVLEGDPAHLGLVNYVGAVSALGLAVERLQAQGHGTAVVLSSIAGVRVRRSNYAYGASKAGLDGFAQGLQQELLDDAVRVVIVRPGFVHTKMTAGLTPAPLSVSAEQVAAAIVRGVRNGEQVVWVPAALRVLAVVLRLLPQRLVSRM
jgi:decaprenylphospho-beta-D-erythro-pentofuranosid-2-ulose 2-reductase